MSNVSILDQYVTLAPSIQNALDIFQAEWASLLPGNLASLRAGNVPLFEDQRVLWAVEQLGGIQGKSVLELGPLEAGHTYMLEQLGAKSILSIEANTRAFLKCLIIKEVMDMRRAQFLCGNFVEYLLNCKDKFDVCFSAGVLYHMTNPAQLISSIAQVSNQVYIWTHYFDHQLIANNPDLAPKFKFEGVSTEYQGFKHTLYHQSYQAALDLEGFCGGSQPFSYWMSRDDILILS